MIRNVRLVLCFLIGLFGWIFYYCLTQAHQWDVKLVTGLLFGLPLLNAIIMLVSLRKGVRQDKDGLCLQSDHLLLKLSREMNSKDYFKPCPLYWKATGLELLVFAIMGILILIFDWVLIKPFYGSFMAWYLILGTASVVGTIWLIKTTYNHSSKLRRLWNHITGILALVVFFGSIIAVGSFIVVTAFFAFYDFGWLVVLKALGIIVLIAIGLVISVALIALTLDTLLKSKVGQRLAKVEINLVPLGPRWCPPIKECEEDQS